MKKLTVLLLSLTALLVFSLLPAGAAIPASEGVLDYAYAAPGGSVENIEELIAAFGSDDFGKPNAQKINGSDTEIRILNTVILQSPIIIKTGSYRIVGGGCTIARGFDSGSLIVLDGTTGQNPTLELERDYGSEYGESDEANIIIDGNSGEHPLSDSALISVKGNASLTLNSRVLFRGAVSSGSGGALSITASFNEETQYYPTVKIYACRFTECHAGSGGAIYFNGMASGKSGGSLVVEKSYFTGCSADNDGGALYTLGGRIALGSVSFDENQAARGGAAYICSEAELNGISMNDNTASESGGGIYCGKDDTSGEMCEMSIINIMALGNHSDGDGGLISNYGVVVVSAFYSDGNTASGNGGSVYNAGSFAYTEGSIINGECGGKGGGVYSTSSGVFIMSGGEINANRASFGGAVYSEGYFEMSGGAIGNNRGGVPEVILKGEITMSGSAVVTKNNIIGLCIYKDKDGNEIIPIIKLQGELTNLAVQTAAFYRETEDGYSAANASGLKLFEGDKAYIDSAVKVFKIEGGFFSSYGIDTDGTLYYKFPVMPIWAWALTLIGVGAAAAVVLIILKKKQKKRETKTELN